ncbi:MAG: iron chelate uptake ABC transporter family permease subunit, partial [Bacillus sp. (in: firmicutes)]
MQRLSILRFLNNKYLAYIIAGIFLFLAILLGISIGTVSVPLLTIIKIIAAKSFGVISLETIDPMYTSIVLNIRLPRVILAGLVGASLAIAGAAFQGLLRNPLADPYTLGVSSGASVGAVLTLFFQLSIPFVGSFTLPLLSIVFSLFTIFLVV